MAPYTLLILSSRPKCNDGIPRDLASLQHISVDDAGHMGPGTKLAKVDIPHAFRNVPIHPDDSHLLSMQWEKQVFTDTCLTLGLCLAPKIISAISDALQWILRQRGMSSCLHYIDDFLTLGKARSDECTQNLQLILTGCTQVGLPVAANKVDGPATTLEFLGI